MTAQLARACKVCQQILTYTGRNRLSDCGHMKRSGGDWVLRNPPASLPLLGQITEHQATEIMRLALDIAQATVAGREADARISEASAALEEYLDVLRIRP
jgi:hypothetical protein